MKLSGRELDCQLVEIIKTKGKIHFNAIFAEIQRSSPGISTRTVSKHLSKLCANGIVHRDLLNLGKKREYSLPAGSEIALLINKDSNLYPNKKFQRNPQGEKLIQGIRIVLIRLAIVSYVKFLDPKLNHGPGTICLPMDKSGNTYSLSLYIKDKKIRPDNLPDEYLVHVPVEPISEAQGVSFRDLQQPPQRMSEIGKLYAHTPLSNEDLKKYIGILTIGDKPIVSRAKLGSNRFRFNTDDRHYHVLKDYVREWLTLLQLLVSMTEFIWRNLREETSDEIKWYDRIFGGFRRTEILLSARANRARLRREHGGKKNETIKQKLDQILNRYNKEIEERIRRIKTNEKYIEFENEYHLLTKILKEEIEEIYKTATQKSRR